MSKLTRRSVLKFGGGLFFGLGAGSLISSCSHVTPAPEKKQDLCANVPVEARSRVAAVRGDDLASMTSKALALIGGIDKVVKPGQTVFIKPNMVTLPWSSSYYNPFRLGECTKPEIVIAAAEACLIAGASAVTIGDGSQRPNFDWSKAVTLDGKTNLAAEASRLSSKYNKPIRLACLDVDSPKWVEVPTKTSLGKVAISSLVVDADHVISIPVAKTHCWAYLTLSLKNLIGITPLKKYGWHDSGSYSRDSLHSNDLGPLGFGRLHIDLAKAVTPHISIIDFSIGMEENGPSTSTGGKPVNVKDRLGSWLVLASTDPVAADATAARIMGEQRYISEILSMANAEGLGEFCESVIQIEGERLADLRMKWKLADIRTW